jgi:SAM-dependent methyltransferase
LLKRIIKKIIKKFGPDPSVAMQKRIYSEFQRALALKPNLSDRLILPERYGQGLPERVVEILLAWLTVSPGFKILDVGYANAMPCHRMMLRKVKGLATLTGVDIAPPTYDASEYYAKAIQADITQVPLPSESFDLIWCISLLEHVGMDNTAYTEDFKRESDMDLLAVREMLRLLRANGKLLITVPYGRFEEHGWFRNYDSVHLKRLFDGIEALAEVKTWYFRHTFGEGWRKAKADELQYVGYYDQRNAGAGGLAAVLLSKR